MKFETLIKHFLLWEQDNLTNGSNIRGTLKNLILKLDLSTRIRYSPVVEHLKKNYSPLYKVLEVGSGSVGITRYFKNRIYGADLNFSGPKLPHLIPVKCSATHLGFQTNHFDLVFSVDMLEHIPKNLRRSVISEMLRVSKKWIIVGFPSGTKAISWEQRVLRFWQRKVGNAKNKDTRERILRRGGFLAEHHDNDLPTDEEIISIVTETAPSFVNIQKFENESPIVWYLLVLGKIRFSNFVWLTTLILGNLLAPLLKRLHICGYYRRFFVIQKLANGNQ